MILTSPSKWKFWNELCYKLKALMRLQKFKPSLFGFVLLFSFIALVGGIASIPFSYATAEDPPKIHIVYNALKIIFSLAVGIALGTCMLILTDAFNFERYEKFTIYFLDCIKSINQLLTKSISDDTLYDYKKFCKIRYKFINYYDEILIYIHYLNLSPDVVKDIISMKNEFDKFSICEELDYKIILCTVKVKSDKLKHTCFSKYRFIYEHEKNLHS